MIRFVGRTSAFHAGSGAMRRAARVRVATPHAISSRSGALQLVFVDPKAPQGGAQAP